MRIIFMGTPDFAVPSLERLVRDGHEVVLAVTQPDKPKGRGNQLTPPPVKEKEETTVNSPILNFDYAGGFNHTLVELADAIPASAFDSVNVN